jgi:hypothetical protein
LRRYVWYVAAPQMFPYSVCLRQRESNDAVGLLLA